MAKQPALTYQQAITKYYGGLQKLSKSALPFGCTCGDKGAYSLGGCWEHIRHTHKERIKKI